MVNSLSYFSFQPVFYDWCNKSRGLCHPICGIVHIEEPLLLSEKRSPCSGGRVFFSSDYLSGHLQHVRRDITVNLKMCKVCHSIKLLYASSHILFLHQSYSTGWNDKLLSRSTMMNGSDEPSHHDWTLYHEREVNTENTLLNDTLSTF